MKRTQELIFGIIGSGIGYSLSPRIFNTLFREEKVPAVYRLFDLRPDGLPEFVRAARLLNVDGFNVTIPFKEDIIEYLHRLDNIAAATGSVNLVLNKKGRWFGYNTDYCGIEATLHRLKALRLKGCRVAIIGSGGAARTVYYLLAKHNVGRISVFHHSARRAESFASYVQGLRHPDSYEAMRFSRRIKSLPDCDLLVNCTPQPLEKMLPEGQLSSAGHIFDLRYAGAGLRGKRIVDGSYMLAVQAAHNFKLMTGVTVAAERVLKIMKSC